MSPLIRGFKDLPAVEPECGSPMPASKFVRLSFYWRDVHVKTIVHQTEPDGTIRFPSVKADRVFVTYGIKQEKPMPKKGAVPKVSVRQPEPPAEPIGAEVLAQSIVEIADAMKKLNATRLKRSTIVALIADRSKLGKGTIEIVLNNLDELEKDWLKPAPTSRLGAAAA